MFNFSKKTSDYDDLYSSLRIEDKFTTMSDDEVQNSDKDLRDPYQSLKEGYSIDKDYEIYIETEKKRLLWQKKLKKNPMETLANKLKKAEELDFSDLKCWV